MARLMALTQSCRTASLSNANRTSDAEWSQPDSQIRSIVPYPQRSPRKYRTALGRCVLAITALLFFTSKLVFAQTTNGLITGSVTDPSGAAVPDAKVDATNQTTHQVRTATSDSSGNYVIPQLPPGEYTVAANKQGFSIENRSGIVLQVNASVTLDFRLSVSSVGQSVTVTSEPPALNTTSATIMDVTAHHTIVGLPLNGRQFTQLTLLAPGAVAQEPSNQAASTVAIGAGGGFVNVNGQNSRENNFTMDGTLNNNTLVDFYAITPPPDALEEFNLQSHITDAQFSISSGANINVETRSGTNQFHGSLWEFFRNSDLDSQQYPATQRYPYRQNQYGVYFGGPLMIPGTRVNGKDSSWFSAYWEGFRSSETLAYLLGTFTTAMTQGNFQAIEGTTPIGYDSLGRPEYQNEIYDPATTRQDPNNPNAVIRDPFPGNVIPTDRINPDAPLLINQYYPAPNLKVAEGVLPNYSYSGATTTTSDTTGIRLDHRFRNNDELFGRYNWQNETYSTPSTAPLNDTSYINDFAQEVTAGYTHLFGQSTILNLRFGWTNTNIQIYNTPTSDAFLAALNLTEAAPPIAGLPMGPTLSIANGFAGTTEGYNPNGPQNNEDSHADLSKTIGHHTLGVGLMVYHLASFSSGGRNSFGFTQNSTSVNAGSTTGYGPASFMLGLPNSFTIFTGNYGVFQSINWLGGYAQDQWQVTPKVELSYGVRYDYVSPPNYAKTVSEVDWLTGQLAITGPVAPYFPAATTAPGLFYPQHNGIQPRLGIAYRAAPNTVVRSAFVVFDDHNNTLEQLNQDPRVSWPSSDRYTGSLLNTGIPCQTGQTTGCQNPTVINELPAASLFLTTLGPYSANATNPHSKIPYVMEYNVGVEQQVASSLVLDLGYVGSMGRHLFIEPAANTAEIPGPGSLASRGQPYPSWPVLTYDEMEGPSAYNALQAKLKKSLSPKLYFMASYTWSKSMDLESDAYNGSIQSVYRTYQDWAPSDYNRTNIFVFSGVYKLPFGTGERYLTSSNRAAQAIAGDWNVGSIITLQSGEPTFAVAGSDIANVGGGNERAERTGANPYLSQTAHKWLNAAAFAVPQQYTFGNERRNDLVGPPYKNWDFNLFKDFPIMDQLTAQFRAEFFNILNHTNYGQPNVTVTSTAFGDITSSIAPRKIQFALKLSF